MLFSYMGPGIVNINDIKDILNEYNNKKNIIIDVEKECN